MPKRLQFLRYAYHFAAEYRDRGWSVLPLLGKTPPTRFSWKRYQQEYPSAKDLRQWFSRDNPNGYNLGIITGKLTGLVVIDCDSKEDADWWVSNFPETPLSAQTGRKKGGRHFYYRISAPLRNRAKLLERAIDLRAEGGYVVAPPSVHPITERSYCWAPWDSYSLDSIPFFDSCWIEPRHSMRRKPIPERPLATGQGVDNLIAELDRNVGDRSARDFAIVIRLLRLGVTPDRMWPLVQNKSKFRTNGHEYFCWTVQNAQEAIAH